jgi:hypothetical protein
MDKELGCGGRKITESPTPETGSPEKDGRKREPSPKEKQETMIRELQGVFCKGRYRSWVQR